MEMMDITSTLWTERYRPTTLDEFIGNTEIKDKIRSYLVQQDIPHLLFFGKAGTGKTSLAKLIVKHIDCDSLYINASDENNVETVRTKIKSFASTISFSAHKFIILDEADYLTINGQAALRVIMEEFSNNCRFIITCNYVERIIEPIRSRSVDFHIFPPSKKDIAIHVAKILANEKVEFVPADILNIVNIHYPDIRKIIGTSQQMSTNGKLNIQKQLLIEGDFHAKLLDILKLEKNKSKQFSDIRQLIANAQIRSFIDTYRLLFDTVDDYTKDIANAIITIAEAQYQDVLVIDKEICFMAMIAKLIDTIK
jgi:DNA polymerase III delta prime subunit